MNTTPANKWREELRQRLVTVYLQALSTLSKRYNDNEVASTGLGTINRERDMLDAEQFADSILTTHSAHLVERLETGKKKLREHSLVSPLESYRINDMEYGFDQAIDIIRRNEINYDNPRK